jgi:hypothetical protein
MGVFKEGLEPGTDEFGYYYLGIYHPFRIRNNRGGKRVIKNPKFDLFSKMVLNLKAGYYSGVIHFQDRLKSIIDAEADISVAIVPAHDNRLATGIRRVAHSLLENNNYTDATECLDRFASLPKLSNGGKRGIKRHLRSIHVINQVLIVDKVVLLLDDVSTTGASFAACERLLLEAGAKSVLCLAIAKTALDNKRCL